ncbi:glycosyltransferase family 2 protein [Novosphingopyxis sp.]|uniref:glycosyltransferase family 2 protein n=1 Tax=Novosphingopyxis sp. TaxID=2709690 RepID=UPI003B5C93D5
MADKFPINFSVAIPLYNKAAFVEQTIALIQAQTLAPTEIVIVDDGSNDDSVARVRSINDPRIKLIQQPNAGPGPARNRAISECENEWVALLDADDWWMENHLSTLAELVTAFPTADMVTSSVRRIVAGASLPEASSQPVDGQLINYFQERVKREVAHSSTVAIRRCSFLETDGFGEKWPSEDSEFWARFALDHIIAATRRVTSYYQVRTGGIMHSGASSEHIRNSVTDSPTIELLDQVLSGNRRKSLHPDIAALREHLILSSVRGALYRGLPTAGRTNLRHAKHQYRWRAMLYRILSYLPPSITQTGIKATSALKRMRN